ncbi:MAG: SPFH domain-containing protein [Phycisphaerales bacterium]|nr:MAG: SPFH domain-containing protein [Phycisphaerales bacterium]
MIGIRYLKTPPTTFVFHYVGGQLKRKGPGLSFFYFSPISEILKVPLTSTTVPFAFNEVTADFQDALIQGELTYRIVDADRVTQVLDFNVDAAGRYRSDDPSKLSERLLNPPQTLVRSFTLRRKLRDLMTSSDALIEHVLAGLKSSELIATLGVEVMDLNVFAIRPSPEMSKAFQADAREELLRKADEAIYARRNAAVELERQIKENELRTEIAVEQKKREVRETKMAADIAVEEQRAAWVDHKVANERKEAEARAYGLKALVEALKETDWKTLTAAGGLTDPRMNIALAFRELADKAEKIGTLNVTPDLLDSLIGEKDTKARKRQSEPRP